MHCIAASKPCRFQNAIALWFPVDAYMAIRFIPPTSNQARVLSSRGYTAEWKLSAGAAILVRHLTDTLPGSTPTLWAIAALSIAGCFLLARHQFQRMEVQVKQEQK